MIDQQAIDALIANLSESRSVEVKRWIDPNSTQGIEKIAKGLLALRNFNGGYFIVGFDDATLQPDLQNEPHNSQALFHVDVIQALVSRFAHEPFEVEVGWGELSGHKYPVIVVPPGVKQAVAAKRDLMDGARFAVRNGSVYFRTLATNGTVSSAEAKPSDWREIFDISFDNREADVGRFLRRHLAGVDLASLLKFSAPPAPVPTLRDEAMKLLDDGEGRFTEAVARRRMDADERALLRFGFWSVALVINPERSGAIPDREFSNLIASSNPKYTGWPIWLDSRFMSNAANREKYIDNAIEYLIVSLSEGWSTHIDFARLDPAGRFFLRRLLQDDGVPSKVAPLAALDPALMILRVAEVIGVALAFAKAMGWEPEEATLGFAFRWDKLKGRQLSSWSHPWDMILDGGEAHVDSVDGYVEVPLDTPLSAVAKYVGDATRKLFASFSGAIIPDHVVEDLTKRLFERRLNG
ncbi:hypothetical protein ACVWW6_008572 [Bradyrhizobium sp. USDA 3311]